MHEPTCTICKQTNKGSYTFNPVTFTYTCDDCNESNAMNSINWNDPTANVSPHFTVREALLLPRWNLLHNPTDKEKEAIRRMADKMEEIRAVLGLPISVHCWIRPTKVNAPDSPHHGKDYNAFVGGTKGSMHIKGLAADFHVLGYGGSVQCHAMRVRLVPHLESLGIRLEDKYGPWLHVDLRTVPAGGKRFFKP